MGTGLAAFGEILGDGENVLRGLNPKHCEDGLPTEGCFILRRNDPPDDGPSHGIHEADHDQAANSPLGAAQGISVAAFLTVLPAPDYGVARLNVGAALDPIRGREIGFVQKDDAKWGNFANAHAMVTGHQSLSNRECKELVRHFTKLAVQSVLKKPATS